MDDPQAPGPAPAPSDAAPAGGPAPPEPPAAPPAPAAAATPPAPRVRKPRAAEQASAAPRVTQGDGFRVVEPADHAAPSMADPAPQIA